MCKFIVSTLLAISLLNFNIMFGQNPEIEKKVNDLLGKMMLDEKIGQMNQYSGFWDVTGPVPKDGYTKMKYEHIKSGKVGSMINVTGTANVRKIQKLAVENSRLGIPIIFGLDVIHGYKTAFPIPLAESTSWDLVAIEKSARIAAIEASAVGLNWTFAPMVDISRDARWGRVMEGAGEDPYLGSKIAIARVKGFQTKDLSTSNTIVACAKHFAAYGFSEAGRDYNTVDIGTSTLFNIVLPSFKASVDAGVRTFINSFNILNGVPATGNSFLQRDILKEKWAFQGFIVSDWASGFEMITHVFARDLKHVAELASVAGSDMDMESYAMSFPRSVGQIPIFYNYNNTGRPLPSQMVYWSHYNDESNKPLYPFGYGLSYTKFQYSNLKIDASNQKSIKVSVTVKNIDKITGEEVVQLYIRDRVASVVRPVKELKGFEKIKLKSAESKTVTFNLTEKELGFYNNQGDFIIEAGDFDVMVGTSSAEGISGSIELK